MLGARIVPTRPLRWPPAKCDKWRRGTSRSYTRLVTDKIRCPCASTVGSVALRQGKWPKLGWVSRLRVHRRETRIARMCPPLEACHSATCFSLAQFFGGYHVIETGSKADSSAQHRGRCENQLQMATATYCFPASWTRLQCWCSTPACSAAQPGSAPTKKVVTS